jgi:hypothetical protein
MGMGNSASGSAWALTNKTVSKDYSSSKTTNGTYFGMEKSQKRVL